MIEQRGQNYPNIIALFGPSNNSAYAKIRQRVEDNIKQIILGNRQQQPKATQGLTQEEVDDLFGHFNDQENQ